MSDIFHSGGYYSDVEIQKIVREYYKSCFSNKGDRHVQMQELFPINISKNSKILDYGCGMGGVSKLFSDKYNCHIDAVEISDNELKKATLTFGDDNNINFTLLNEFDFPKETYDFIFSSQVIEHVHNPGNYLSKINSMLKKEGHLLIGLPNIVNLNYLLNSAFFSQKRAIKRSKYILENYYKAGDHINGWDPYHFTTLLASCGLELVRYISTEGTPIFSFLKNIPIIGKYIYILPFRTRLSYTMFFLVKKVRQVNIGNDE